MHYPITNKARSCTLSLFQLLNMPRVFQLFTPTLFLIANRGVSSIAEPDVYRIIKVFHLWSGRHEYLFCL